MRIAPFVVTRSLERREQRAAGLGELADGRAFAVAQIGGVGDQQSAIPAECLGRQVFLVDEVKDEASFEQGVVKSLERIGACEVRVTLASRVTGAVEGDRALGIQHGDVSNRAAVAEMRLV